MTERVRFEHWEEDASGGGSGMSFEQMMDALYRVLRKHPEAMADVEASFGGMVKGRVAGDEPG